MNITKADLKTAKQIIDAISKELCLEPNRLRVQRRLLTWDGINFYEKAELFINPKKVSTKSRGNPLDPADPELVEKIRNLVAKAETEHVEICCELMI